MVVNQAFADHFFPKGDAIGHSFTVGDPCVKASGRSSALSGNSKLVSPREETQRMAYLAVMQLTEDDHYAYWMRSEPLAIRHCVAGAVRGAFTEIDPNLPVLTVKTIQRAGERSAWTMSASFPSCRPSFPD